MKTYSILPLIATVTFKPSNTVGLTIMVRNGDFPTGDNNFAHHRGITTIAPTGTTQAEVKFANIAIGGHGCQDINIDDVSLSVD